MTFIRGLSAFYHNCAACLLKDGKVYSAAQEDRSTRNKGDASFPGQSFRFVSLRCWSWPVTLGICRFFTIGFLVACSVPPENAEIEKP